MSDLYIMGYSDALLRFLASRNVANTCGYLESCLKAGQRVLDVGCGPGSLSVRLAQAIAPGQLLGIDIEPGQLAMAAQAAAKQGLDNAAFSIADARDLPFDDGSFDLVHCNDVLAFIPETEVVLSEIKRVLKPGGILGCREIIMDSFVIHPDPGPLARAYAVFAEVLTADDGHPQMGRELPARLVRAGFTDIRPSAAFDTFGTPERLKITYDLGQSWFLSSDVENPAVQYGAADSDMFESIRQATEEWYSAPGAMSAYAYGEAVAVKP